MSRTLTQVDPSIQTFNQLYSLVNGGLAAFSETVTIAANTAGDATAGNGFVTGIFGGTTLVANAIRGGTVAAAANLTVSSNAAFTGGLVNVVANVYAYGSAVVLGSNSTVNVISIAGNSSATNLSFNATTVNLSGSMAVASDVTVSNTLAVTGNVSTGDLTVGTSLVMSANSKTTTSTAAAIVDSFSTTLYRGAKYILTSKDTDNTTFQVTELLILQDGTTTYLTEYATITTAGSLGTFSANVNGTTARLYVTPTVTNMVTKVAKTLLVV